MNQQRIVIILAALQTSPYVRSMVTHTFCHNNQQLFSLSYSEPLQAFHINCLETNQQQEYTKLQDATEAIKALLK
ncbi:hypothetical protein ACFQPF_01250 [Fictibacillus iocasae]|uniref:Uncharacterized protein n=1 Tax=Fictibacillus iocasae TaxID=2715437 RepID=A0ABW2NLX6_9BACL